MLKYSARLSVESELSGVERHYADPLGSARLSVESELSGVERHFYQTTSAFRYRLRIEIFFILTLPIETKKNEHGDNFDNLSTFLTRSDR